MFNGDGFAVAQPRSLAPPCGRVGRRPGSDARGRAPSASSRVAKGSGGIETVSCVEDQEWHLVKFTAGPVMPPSRCFCQALFSADTSMAGFVSSPEGHGRW